MELTKEFAKKIILTTSDEDVKNIIFDAFPGMRMDMLIDKAFEEVDVYEYAKKKALANIVNKNWKRTLNNEGYFFYKEKDYFVISKHYSAMYDDIIYLKSKQVCIEVIQYLYGNDVKIHK